MSVIVGASCKVCVACAIDAGMTNNGKFKAQTRPGLSLVFKAYFAMSGAKAAAPCLFKWKPTSKF